MTLMSRLYSIEVAGTGEWADRRATAFQPEAIAHVSAMQVSVSVYRRGRASKRWARVPSLCRIYAKWSEAVAYCDESVVTDAPETLALFGRWREVTA